MDFIIFLLQNGFYLPWISLSPLHRYAIAILVIGYPVVYIFLAFKYKRLAREAEKTILLAPILGKGGIVSEMGNHEIGLALRANWADVMNPTWKDAQHQASLYPIHSTISDFMVSMSLARAGANLIPLRLSENPTQWELKEEFIVKIASFEIPVGTLANLLLAFLRIMPVPYRKRYLASMIYVSLVSIGDQTQLVVSRKRQKTSLPNSPKKGKETYNDSEVLSEVKTVKNIESLTKDLLRDAVFMILQIHGKGFTRLNWRSMRYSGDGIEYLQKYQQTSDESLIEKATQSFRYAIENDWANYSALYLYGAMIMAKRTLGEINIAIKVFERALKTEDRLLRAYVNAGLAYCYAQQFHRLAKRESSVIEKAQIHAEQARIDLEAEKAQHDSKQELTSDHGLSLILYIRALVQHIDEGSLQTREDTKKRFLLASTLYYQALKKQPENGMIYNNLGWVFLKLAEWGIEDVKYEEDYYKELEGNPALTSEKLFLRSIELDPKNKLSFANICLLYATPWFRKPNLKNFLDRCRFYGLKAIDLDPQYINGHRDLSLSLLRHREFKEASHYFKKALELAPTYEKREEIISDTLNVLSEMSVSKEEIERWCEEVNLNLAEDWVEPS